MFSVKSTGNLWHDLFNCCRGSYSYLSCRECCRRSQSNLDEKDNLINFSSGESDSEFVMPFIDLDTDEKSKRLKFLWCKAIGRARGAVLIVDKLKYLRKKILLTGRLPDAQEAKLKEEQASLDLKDAKCVILPDNRHKQRWDIFIAFLLVVTAVYVPLRVSFYDETSLGFLLFDSFFDVLFFLDIVLTFFTAY